MNVSVVEFPPALCEEMFRIVFEGQRPAACSKIRLMTVFVEATGKLGYTVFLLYEHEHVRGSSAQLDYSAVWMFKIPGLFKECI